MKIRANIMERRKENVCSALKKICFPFSTNPYFLLYNLLCDFPFCWIIKQVWSGGKCCYTNTMRNFLNKSGKKWIKIRNTFLKRVTTSGLKRLSWACCRLIHAYWQRSFLYNFQPVANMKIWRELRIKPKWTNIDLGDYSRACFYSSVVLNTHWSSSIINKTIGE